MKVTTGKRIAIKTKKYLARRVRGIDLFDSSLAAKLLAMRIPGVLFIVQIIILTNFYI